MTFWRPAHEWRGTRDPRFTSPKLMLVEMSEKAAELIYRRFNLVPELHPAANDRDQVVSQFEKGEEK